MLAGLALVMAVVEPYRMARLTSFINPWKDAGGKGFQSVQAMIAMGSGGFFGRGLGESVQKIFYLPEAHTDMILAVIGEELGVIGVTVLAALYGMIGYAGFRAAKAGQGPLLEAAGHRDHLADPGPGDPELLRGDGHGAAHGRAAAVRVLRQLQPRSCCWPAMGLVLGVAADGGAASARAARRSTEAGDDEQRRPAARADRGGRHGGPRRAGAGDSRRAAR